MTSGLRERDSLSLSHTPLLMSSKINLKKQKKIWILPTNNNKTVAAGVLPSSEPLSHTSDPLIKESANAFKCFQVLADSWANAFGRVVNGLGVRGSGGWACHSESRPGGWKRWKKGADYGVRSEANRSFWNQRCHV